MLVRVKIESKMIPRLSKLTGSYINYDYVYHKAGLKTPCP